MYKLYAKKIIAFLLGTFIIQIGCAFFLNSKAGADSISVFNEGVGHTFNITTGNAFYILLGVSFVALLIFAREKINLGTFLGLLSAGIFLDIAQVAIDQLNIDALPLIVRLLIVFGSCFIIALGVAVQKSANLGIAPHDEIPFLITELTKIEYRWVRMGLDFIFIIAGYLLGGVIGFGTIITLLAIGPCIQFFLPKVEGPLNSFVNGTNE
ncbi:MAG TPA: membrane protein [Firmicutes bacterium]|nr:membrane protein [Bacillota bacterium]